MKTQRKTRSSSAGQQSSTTSRKHVVKGTLTSDMVIAALTALKDGSGSSAQSIKNYIKTTYRDTSSVGPALKEAASQGKIELVVGKGPLHLYRLARSTKSSRVKGSIKKDRKASTNPKTTSKLHVVGKRQTKGNKGTAKKLPRKGIKDVSKQSVTPKATPCKKPPTLKTSRKTSAKAAQRPLRNTPKKRSMKKTASETRDNLFSSFVLCGHYFHLPKVSRGASSSITPVTMMHTKARLPTYPNSSVKRSPVPDDKVAWKVDWPEYDPVKYTDPHVKAGPVWADPDISQDGAPILKFNSIDGKVNRRSYIGNYDCVNGIPRNPCGRTGMIERGLLGKWGPNHAADPIVTRWKRDSSGKKVLHPTSGKPILQFISIRRKDSGEWAIPGGMVDAGEKVSQTLKREFGEEAMNSLSLDPKDCKAVEKAVANLFKHGVEVYRGYVDDPRNTDNSWMETMAVNFHDDQGTSVAKFSLHAGDDAAAVQWHDVGSDMQLYASHSSFIEMVTKRIGAHW